MPLDADAVGRLDPQTQAWMLSRAEGRLEQHEQATAAQEGRAVVVLTTSVALASLAGLVAATALSLHHDSSVVVTASLIAMVGFTLSSVLSWAPCGPGASKDRALHPRKLRTPAMGRLGSTS